MRNNSRLFNICLCLFVLCALTVGCRRTDKETAKSLEGNWDLRIGDECSKFDVASEHLTLRSGGVLEQHTVSKRGYHYDAVDEKWEYVPPHSVALDKRKDFFKNQPPNEFVGVRGLAVLPLELNHPKIILLDADSNCFYTQTK